MRTKWKRDPGFSKRVTTFFERMRATGYSRRALSRLLDGPKSRSWEGKLTRWSDPKYGRPPRPEIAAFVSGIKLREPEGTVAWLYDGAAEPVWVGDRHEVPWLAGAAPIFAADPAAASSAALSSGAIGLRAAVGSENVASPTTARRSMPSSVRALLSDVREGSVTLDEAERMLEAIFSRGMPSSSWRSTQSPLSSKIIRLSKIQRPITK